jgi:putative DNA primase/helicase
MNSPPSIDTIRDALSFIPPNLSRDEWARVAMALKSELDDDGFDLFDAWSKGADTYTEADARNAWRSVKAGGAVGIATLFHLAKQGGFKFDAQTPAPRLTPEELKAQEAKRRASIERDRVEREARHVEAAAEALKLWEQATEAGESPYLSAKGVRGYGVRYTAARALLVPMRDAAGKLWNVQTIKPMRPADGGPDKLFQKGGRKSGSMHWCGDPEGAPVLLIAEGYATAASVHEATGRPVCVAFDAGNLLHVVRALRGRYRDARLQVCGDDDTATEARTKRNPGREKATEAAKLAGGVPVFPVGLPDGASDFNDMHTHVGLDAVHELVEQAIQAAAKRAARATEASEGARTPDRAKKTPPRPGNRAAQGEAGKAASGTARFDRFRVEGECLWVDVPSGAEGVGNQTVRVCGALHVTALGRDAHDNGAALLLEFNTPFGKCRQWLMPLAMLAGDGTAYRSELLNQGFMVPTDAKKRAYLTSYLQSRAPVDRVKIVDRVGWHGRAYVLPRETLGDDGGERIIFQSETPTEGTFAQRGTLDEWRERIGRLCVGNSRLMFAASCAFAGPLLMWAAGTDGGGVHLMGDSSSGKTTALKVAASVFGGRDYLQRWRATDNGLEGMAAQHSDALLCLDELAQLDAKVAGESAYMLANGQGKSRAGRTGAARPRLSWRLLFLSAGEIGLAEHMSEANKRARAGQELRMIDLPADAGAGRGVFEELHDFESGGALAQHLAQATERTYGTPGRLWLEWLTDNPEGLAQILRKRMGVIERRIVPELASGQVQRVGRRFALIAAAGELATEAGITQWPAGEATNAVHRCFSAWIEARPGGIGLTEETQMLRQIRGWFALHGAARFVSWDRGDDDHAPNVVNRAGWRKPIKDATCDASSVEWLVLPDVFRTEVCKGFTARAALRLLKERGHLHAEKGDQFSCRVSPPGTGKVQVYRIKSSLLADTGEGDGSD